MFFDIHLFFFNKTDETVSKGCAGNTTIKTWTRQERKGQDWAGMDGTRCYININGGFDKSGNNNKSDVSI